MFNLYSLFVVAQMSFVLIDDAKIRRFLVSFQTFSLFFYQKLWTKNPFMDKSKKSRRVLSTKGLFFVFSYAIRRVKHRK